MPPNNVKKRICTEIIKSGPNKGKRCCDVKKYCLTAKHAKKYKNSVNNINNSNLNSSSINDNNNNNGGMVAGNGSNNHSNNNNTTINIHFGKNDDLNEILSKLMGEKEAKEFILNCAKSKLEGDRKMIMKTYFNGPEDTYPIRFIDRSRRKLEYTNELGETIVDSNGMETSKRLCGSLQNSYLSYVNEILIANLDQKDDGKFLDEFDIQNCQEHIYNLSDHKYRYKVLNCIP